MGIRKYFNEKVIKLKHIKTSGLQPKCAERKFIALKCVIRGGKRMKKQ